MLLTRLRCKAVALFNGAHYQDFEPFDVQLRRENANPGRVAAGPRHAGREPAADHVISHADDRNRLGCALHSSDGRVREDDDDIDILCDELLGQRRRALVAALGPNEQEANVTPVFPAYCPHIAPERFGELIDILRNRPQHPDHRQAALLRARREWPRGCRAAEQRDELSAPHSITSSTLASSCGGTSRPSALAVCRLMANSNLVDCNTGSSAGLAPLMMLPV